MKQAYAIHDLELPMLLPGIKVNTSPTDHVPVDQMQFMRFNGKTWERFGELQTGNSFPARQAQRISTRRPGLEPGPYRVIYRWGDVADAIGTD